MDTNRNCCEQIFCPLSKVKESKGLFCPFLLLACRRCLWMETTSAPCLMRWVACFSSTAWGFPSTASLMSLLCWRDWVQLTSWLWLGTEWRVWICALWSEWATWKTLTSGKRPVRNKQLSASVLPFDSSHSVLSFSAWSSAQPYVIE